MINICPKCENEIDKKSFECECCWETMCWDHCAMEDQGRDPRCFCEECHDFCEEQGIFDNSED